MPTKRNTNLISIISLCVCVCLYWIPCKCCAPIPSDSIRWNIARRLQQWIFIKRWCTSLPMECALQPSSEWASDVKKWEFSYARKAVGNEQKMNVKLAFFFHPSRLMGSVRWLLCCCSFLELFDRANHRSGNGIENEKRICHKRKTIFNGGGGAGGSPAKHVPTMRMNNMHTWPPYRIESVRDEASFSFSQKIDIIIKWIFNWHMNDTHTHTRALDFWKFPTVLLLPWQRYFR